MPLFDFECPKCGRRMEALVSAHEAPPICCANFMDKLMTAAPSFRMVGLRASSGYGLKHVDTKGKDLGGELCSGYSFTSNRGFTNEHNQGAA